MEALILIFGELIFAMLAPFIALVVDFIASILGLIFSFLPSRKSGAVLTARATRKVAMILGAVAGIIILAIGTVNTFYFDGAVRYVLSSAEKRTDIAVACEEIDGSLFAGRVDLRDCSIRRTDHPTASFEFTLQDASLDIRLSSLLGTAEVELARVVGLKGWLNSNRNASQRTAEPDAVEKPRRSFVIEELDVADVSIALSGINPDGNAFELPVAIGRMQSEPLRSRFALFDILFRSNASGSIAGAPFEIVTSVIEDGRKTAWRAEQVPVANFGAIAGGALSWFADGHVDVRVDDEWQRGDSLSIDMDWQLAFENLVVAPPEGTGRLARIAAEPLTRYINSHDGNFPLEFSMVISENQFEHKSSLAAAGLWTAVGESINKTLGTIGVKLEDAQETGDSLKESARSVLDRLRKPKEEE